MRLLYSAAVRLRTGPMSRVAELPLFGTRIPIESGPRWFLCLLSKPCSTPSGPWCIYMHETTNETEPLPLPLPLTWVLHGI